MNKQSAFSPSDSLKGEPEKATNDNKMNKSILKYLLKSPLSGDLGVKCELASGRLRGILWRRSGMNDEVSEMK
ncbi:hypothetical protein D1164_05545 [Mariniphaga sediminis]|uniref:Uncharacterized protein n=1 Tax=Mariniphaga sediminis TaxID=1628158 RepID=A0A399D3Z6_9BACT|nr:hypothetical protein [Mariniphaga sediminis]RIH66369.1 hypothetical protein D1164_05545 [Mariniphaga sediminis]